MGAAGGSGGGGGGGSGYSPNKRRATSYGSQVGLCLWMACRDAATCKHAGILPPGGARRLPDPVWPACSAAPAPLPELGLCALPDAALRLKSCSTMRGATSRALAATEAAAAACRLCLVLTHSRRLPTAALLGTAATMSATSKSAVWLYLSCMQGDQQAGGVRHRNLQIAGRPARTFLCSSDWAQGTGRPTFASRCHGTGHWASNCPNQGNNGGYGGGGSNFAGSRYKADGAGSTWGGPQGGAGAFGSGGRSNACFKVAGQWGCGTTSAAGVQLAWLSLPACPMQAGPQPCLLRSHAPYTPQVPCAQCGHEGHWGKDCPNNGNGGGGGYGGGGGSYSGAGGGGGGYGGGGCFNVSLLRLQCMPAPPSVRCRPGPPACWWHRGQPRFPSPLLSTIASHHHHHTTAPHASWPFPFLCQCGETTHWSKDCPTRGGGGGGGYSAGGGKRKWDGGGGGGYGKGKNW